MLVIGIMSFKIKMLFQCINLKKKFVKKSLHQFAIEKPYFPYKTILERMVSLTSSLNNIHELANNNSNPYKTMAMVEMKMNKNYLDKGSCNFFLDEESNIDLA